MKHRPFVRALAASAALAASLALAGCNTDGIDSAKLAKALKPLPAAVLAEMEQKNMDKESPILIRVFKQESELELWKQDRNGQFALLKTYPICRWSGDLGPKIQQGDRQAPEGFYTITKGQMNPNSSYYLSFNLGYPNAFDKALGRTGSHLMVHGDCSSAGCYAMTDEQISEIYAFGRDAFFGGQRAFQVQAYPFRMTPVNMAKHRNNPHMPFWKMIKEGYDHFEVTRTEPKVDVCEKRYVFNAQARGGASTALSFSASAKCPDYEVAPEIMAAVRDKQRKDEVQTAELIRKGTPAAPVKLASDGGMHQNFAWKLSGGEVRDAAGNIRGFQPGTAPGVIRDGGGPFRSAEPEAPTGTVVAATAPSRAETAKAGPEPKVRVASAGPADAEESPGMFGRMKSTMGRWIGLGGSEAAPEPAKSKPEPKPARTARPAPKPAEPEKAAPSAPKRAPEKPLGEPEVRSAAAAPPAAAPSAPAAMSGSQPVVPSSSFESRWSFR